MILYPTIELQTGRCVSLHRGRLAEPQIWHVDAVAKAQEFAAAGASWMQVTDFDAVDGGPGHEELVAEIILKAGIPVQLGGGMRSRERIERWIERGAGRVVVGTLAVQDPDLVKALAYQYPDQLVLAVDVFEGRVMADGWRNATAFAPGDFIAAFEGTPLAAVKITDIDSDIGDGEATLGMISGLADDCRTPVIASGLVHTLDDISRLKYVRNVAGAVVGRALFRKAFELEQALAIAEAPLEPAADFI